MDSTTFFFFCEVALRVVYFWECFVFMIESVMVRIWCLPQRREVGSRNSSGAFFFFLVWQLSYFEGDVVKGKNTSVNWLYSIFSLFFKYFAVVFTSLLSFNSVATTSEMLFSAFSLLFYSFFFIGHIVTQVFCFIVAAAAVAACSVTCFLF